MSFVSGYKGVVGLVFGNEGSASNEDRYVERLLDRIHNGTKAEDRRSAMVELQSVVAESDGAQLAFGAIGFPVILSVLKEERDDVEMVRGALETLLGSLTPLNLAKPAKIEVEPSKMNADLLSREVDNISLLLGLLEEDDFYVRYYTLQVLTALLTNSSSRLQESILAIPRGMTRLMDMMMDREVIRNEALLLLTYLTREAEEIQKIVVFEGAFEKIFSIIKEEGALDGGVVVQDCLELLNNVLRNTSNQTLLRETVGFDPIISLLRVRGSTFNFAQQKTANLLCALETINMLITNGPHTDMAKDTNIMTNKTALAQQKLLDYLLMLGVESQWAPVAVRCAALRCLGDLIARHPKNLNELANKVIGDELREEPALNSILRIILRTTTLQEFVAADYVFKNFCERNPDGQKLLATTLTPPPHSMSHAPLEEDTSMSFGSMLIHGLTVGENDGELEICARAASVLTYLLKDNIPCKEKAVKIELETPMQSMGTPEPLMHRIMKYLAHASSMNKKDGKSDENPNAYIQQLILKLLFIWLVDCPSAVQCFLDSRAHLTYLLELLSNQSATVSIRGLAAVLLGECVLYNKCIESGKDSYAIVDAISQKCGLSSYFSKFDDMQKSFLFSPERFPKQREPLNGIMTGTEDQTDASGKMNNVHPFLASVFDPGFVALVGVLERKIRERFVEVYSNPKANVAVVPAELEKRSGESDGDYINRLKSFVEKQCSEVQDLLARNASLAEELAKTGAKPNPEQKTNLPSDRVQVDGLRRELQEASTRLEMFKSEKAKLESEASMYKNLAAKVESDLKSLSDAYNSLERANMQLEKEAKATRGGGAPEIEAIKAEVREEAQKESEAELNDLLVCLGQEQSRVERLSARLVELGEDVDKLLEGIGDDAGLPEGDDDDNEEEDD